MTGRIKIQVWSTAQQRWRTAYCRSPGNLDQNLTRLHMLGFKVRL